MLHFLDSPPLFLLRVTWKTFTPTKAAPGARGTISTAPPAGPDQPCTTVATDNTLIGVEVEVVASGAAAGTVRTRWVVEGGRLVAVAPAGADDPPAATTIPVTAEALAAFARGEADPAVAFMRGDRSSLPADGVERRCVCGSM